LELSAAAVAVNMDIMIRNELEITLDQSIFWTDSTVVLSYINNVDKKFQTFVANRVAVIHEGSKPSQWRYVNTKTNPADVASRGLRVDEIINNEKWFSGPSFLRLDEQQWPVNLASRLDLLDGDPEVKRDSVIYAVDASPSEESDVMNRIFSKYSDWYKLRKTVAWLLRTKKVLKGNVDKSASRMTDPLSVADLQQSELEIVKYVQRQVFREEYVELMKGSQTNNRFLKKSQLYRLEPMMIGDVICVGGRLQNHPMIIPRNHDVVNLIVRHYHEASGHSGKEHVLALTRQYYWILGARTVIRKVLKMCTLCRLRNPKP
jgi:hypothetical protein